MLDLPLFPGYVFVQFDLHDRIGVLEVPGVVSMIGTVRVRRPLPELEVGALRTGLDPQRLNRTRCSRWVSECASSRAHSRE